MFLLPGGQLSRLKATPKAKRTEKLQGPKPDTLKPASQKPATPRCGMPRGRNPRGGTPKPGPSGKGGNSGEVSIFEIKEFKLRKHQKRSTVCKESFPDWSSLTEHWKKNMGAKTHTNVINVTK